MSRQNFADLRNSEAERAMAWQSVRLCASSMAKLQYCPQSLQVFAAVHEPDNSIVPPYRHCNCASACTSPQSGCQRPETRDLIVAVEAKLELQPLTHLQCSHAQNCQLHAKAIASPRSLASKEPLSPILALATSAWVVFQSFQCAGRYSSALKRPPACG